MPDSLTTAALIDPPLTLGTTLLGRYKLKTLLGEGIFGPVYLAEDQFRIGVAPNADVALKVINPEIAREMGGLAGLAPSLSAACRISHPNIVNVLDFQEHDGHIVVLMERLSGKTLRTLIDEGSLGEQRLSMITQCLEGLDYAHRSIAYRRLNPAKLWVQEDGRFKIADLGLAYHLDPTLWVNQAVEMGEATYLSPEILTTSQIADQRADQYSLAVIAFELLTGSSAIRSEESMTVLKHTCSRAQVDSFQTALSLNPADRFGKTSDFAQPFLDERSHYRRHPLSRLTNSRLKLFTLSCLLVTTLAGSLWLKSPPNDKLLPGSTFQQAKSEIDEIFHAVDDQKLELYALGLHRPSFAEGIRKHANGTNEMRLMATLSALSLESSRDETKALTALEAVRDALKSHLDGLEHARKAILAIDRLDACKKIHHAVHEVVSWPPTEMETFEAAHRSAVDTFNSGSFEESARTAQIAEETFHRALDAKLATQIQAAEEAQALWTSYLSGRDQPFVEPTQGPSRLLLEGSKHLSKQQWGPGITGIKEAESIWSLWTDAVEAIPSRLPEETENTLGMRFRTTGSLQMAIWETRVIDFLAFIANDGIDPNRQWREFAIKTDQGPTHPVAFVNHHDAVRFCEWLTEREHHANRIRKDQRYRLPTDREWSVAVGLPLESGPTPEARRIENLDLYPWGTQPIKHAKFGNYDTHRDQATNDVLRELQDPFKWTSPVGSFAANAQGLYDMGGNVFEWVSDRWETHDDPAEQAAYRFIGLDHKVVRGGSYLTLSLHYRRSSFRQYQRFGNEDTGFRIVLVDEPSRN